MIFEEFIYKRHVIVFPVKKKMFKSDHSEYSILIKKILCQRVFSPNKTIIFFPYLNIDNMVNVLHRYVLLTYS